MAGAVRVHCRLTYFNFRALGEPVRLLLNYGNIQYEDVRLDRFGQQWIDLKPNYPMGQLPLLEIDGVKLHQSKAICRYLGKKCNLYGNNDKEAANIDIVADVIYDFIMKMRVLRDIDNPEDNEKKYKQFNSTFIPLYLDSLDKFAMENDGFLANKKLSWADLYFTGAVDYLSMLSRKKDILSQYDNLKRVSNNVLNLSQLQEYVKTRPDSEF